MQRNFKNNGMLSGERLALLESLNYWTWDVNSDKWEHGYSQLLSFLDVNKGRAPRDKEKTDEGFGIGAWIANQRVRFHRLYPDQQKRLMAFEWFQPLDK